MLQNSSSKRDVFCGCFSPVPTLAVPGAQLAGRDLGQPINMLMQEGGSGRSNSSVSGGGGSRSRNRS